MCWSFFNLISRLCISIKFWSFRTSSRIGMRWIDTDTVEPSWGTRGWSPVSRCPQSGLQICTLHCKHWTLTIINVALWDIDIVVPLLVTSVHYASLRITVHPSCCGQTCKQCFMTLKSHIYPILQIFNSLLIIQGSFKDQTGVSTKLLMFVCLVGDSLWM